MVSDGIRWADTMVSGELVQPGPPGHRRKERGEADSEAAGQVHHRQGRRPNKTQADDGADPDGADEHVNRRRVHRPMMPKAGALGSHVRVNLPGLGGRDAVAYAGPCSFATVRTSPYGQPRRRPMITPMPDCSI